MSDGGRGWGKVTRIGLLQRPKNEVLRCFTISPESTTTNSHKNEPTCMRSFISDLEMEATALLSSAGVVPLIGPPDGGSGVGGGGGGCDGREGLD